MEGRRLLSPLNFEWHSFNSDSDCDEDDIDREALDEDFRAENLLGGVYEVTLAKDELLQGITTVGWCSRSYDMECKGIIF